MTTIRAQSAVEYLSSYGWAVVVIAVVLAALFAYGILNPNIFFTQSCTFPSDFKCVAPLLVSNGLLYVNLTQETASPINITGVACDTAQSIRHVTKISPAVFLGLNENYSTSTQCWSNSSVFSGSVGSIYHGYLIVNYTDVSTSFKYTAIGTVVAKATQ